MTTYTVGRWLLVGIAILGLALLAPVVSAHGTGPTADEAPSYNATAEGWATWMEAQMTDHMGPDSVEWMEAHMGVPVDEMSRLMADGDYGDHPRYGHGLGMYGPGAGMYGPGHGTNGPGGGC